MSTEKIKNLLGDRVEILEMTIKNVDNQLQLLLKTQHAEDVLLMSFYNVSRFKMGEISTPLEIQGFEIVDHSIDGWAKDSIYEIRDFEDDNIKFFCESFKVERTQ